MALPELRTSAPSSMLQHQHLSCGKTPTQRNQAAVQGLLEAQTE